MDRWSCLNRNQTYSNRTTIKNYKKKILGNETKSKVAQAGFTQNKLGYEMGVLMYTKKNTILEKVNLNVASCTYDTIFYRLNIYKKLASGEFENILKEPIYIQFEKEKIKETIQVDLSKYGIEVEGDFLVTVELVKDLGKGHLFFSCNTSIIALFSNRDKYKNVIM